MRLHLYTWQFQSVSSQAQNNNQLNWFHLKVIDFKMSLLKTLFLTQVICYLVFASPLYPSKNRRQMQKWRQRPDARLRSSVGPLARKLFTGFGKYYTPKTRFSGLLIKFWYITFFWERNKLEFFFDIYGVP